ncbi:MAG TPA: type VI secretion system-associated FHA domain protein TagH [Steroidobacteraceae bacterium]|nr:type VI secretion system-associated FHA domain protein TagH [Steroidobacteraceae bacterium]
MPLKLRVISDQYKQLGKTSSQLFGVSGGKIGRAPDNDWILPDADRYVSSHHARVSFRAGNWMLEDTSTNGVFVNESDTPLSVTGPRKLKDGDRLRFGDYDIIVSIDGHNDFSADASGQMPTPPSVPDRRTKKAPAPRQAVDNFGDDLGEELDITGLFMTGMREAEDQSDAVAAFDKSALNAKPVAAVVAKPIASPASLLDGYLNVEPKRAAAENGEEWHMTTRRLQGRKPAAANAAPTLHAVTQTPAPAREPSAKDFQLRDVPARDTAPIKVEPSDRGRRNGSDGYAELQAGIEAFCRGAGIEPSALPADSQASLLGLAGQMVREVVLDLMEALRGRGEDKTNMRIGQTMIGPMQNNPLKFSSSVEDALRKLLDGHSNRFLGPVEALREAFNDLKNHQLAMDAGTHAAINDLLQRVDPGELQERFDRGLKRNPPLGNVNKGKYWELYCDFYPLLNQRDTRGWPAVFTEEFSRIYAEKIEDLEKKRR